jgi:ABC-2 type transport system permease protein
MTTWFGALRRQVRIAGAMAAIQPKYFLAFTSWVWMELFARVLGMVIVTSFWRAVYDSSTSISGLSYQQTINYILLAQVFSSLAANSVMWWVGWWIRDGQIIVEMLRPIDFQWQVLVQVLSNNVFSVIVNLPLMLLAVLVFDLRLPSDPLVWGAFLVSAFFGQLAVFFFDWAYMCLCFYTTEVWGLGVFREGFVLFLSGLLIPLQMMPDWLRGVAGVFPFAQALGMPVSILSGATPLADAPQVWAVQLLWAVGGFFASRWVFSIASRKVTIQGG